MKPPTHRWDTNGLAITSSSSLLSDSVSCRGGGGEDTPLQLLEDENEEYEYVDYDDEEDGYYYDVDEGDENDIVEYEEDKEYEEEYYEEDDDTDYSQQNILSRHRHILPSIRHSIIRPIPSQAAFIAYNLNTLPSLLSTNISRLSNRISTIPKLISIPDGSLVILSLATLTILSVRGIILFSKSRRDDSGNSTNDDDKRNKLKRLFKRKDKPNDNNGSDKTGKRNKLRRLFRRKRPKDKADKEDTKKSYSFGNYSKGYPGEEALSKSNIDDNHDRDDKMMHTLNQLLKHSQSQKTTLLNIQDELGLGLELGSMKGELVTLRDRCAGMEQSLQTMLGIGFGAFYTNSDTVMERFDILEDRFIDMENKLRYQQELLLELKKQKGDGEDNENVIDVEDDGDTMDLDVVDTHKNSLEK